MCPVRGPLDAIHKAIVGVLKNISLADVLKKTPPVTTFQPVLSLLSHRAPAELQEITA
jgi:hypothetical protein